MDYAGGEGLPDLPVKARWDLPAMAKGDTWSGSYTVPGEAAGYYSVMANAYTRGPDGGPWLFDDVLGEAWMYVSETDGRLTRFFEDSVFPEGVHPAAGPATGWPAGPPARIESGSPWHPDSVYLAVVYRVSEREGFKPAAGAEIRGWVRMGSWPYRTIEDLGVVAVPEDSESPEHFLPGTVAFKCAKDSVLVHGVGYAPYTDLVQGREDIVSIWTDKSHCGQLVFVEVKAERYLPWRLLNLAADTLTGHFGYTRERIGWDLRFDSGASYYNPIPIFEKIVLAWLPAEPRFFFTVAHEYGHALHHKALGGLWWPGDKAWDYWDWTCFSHWFTKVTNFRCALQEGFAHYAGVIGSGGYYEDCFEHFGDPAKPLKNPREGSCRAEAPQGKKPKIEGHIAALFLDLTDGNNERYDWTEYPGRYVAEVFKTCKTQSKYHIPLFPDIYIWWKRTNVSNIVWCLENYIDRALHKEVFPGIRTPEAVKEKATEPPDWDPLDIRATWLKNLK